MERMMWPIHLVKASHGRNDNRDNQRPISVSRPVERTYTVTPVKEGQLFQSCQRGGCRKRSKCHRRELYSLRHRLFDPQTFPNRIGFRQARSEETLNGTADAAAASGGSRTDGARRLRAQSSPIRTAIQLFRYSRGNYTVTPVLQDTILLLPPLR
jgi:hypothetical protein